jgi:NAD(P)-dependent dehydrogenase (short-subunit alcohol dehydrogenase family)
MYKMKNERIFLLFNASGSLGKAAVNYFLKTSFDYYYFFSRESIEIKSEKKNYEIIKVMDLTNDANVKSAFGNVKINTNASYFLFNTIGGFYGGKTIANTEYDEWLRMQNINFNTSFLIAKHFARLAADVWGGSICFTSALSSLELETAKAAYNISKNSLNLLVKTLALEGKDIGLSANAVAPYIIDTPSNREWVKDISKLINPDAICNVVNLLFENYRVMSGNIIELPGTLNEK